MAAAMMAAAEGGGAATGEPERILNQDEIDSLLGFDNKAEGGGKLDGIATGQAVIGADGLVGRVVEAGQGSARVLMLTDINSRVPVISESSREKSIAAGNNSETLSLDYVATGSEMKVGERLLTSGDGGVFPPGIPVGIISSIQNGNVLVEPVTDWSRLEYISAVDYHF